MWVGDAMRLRDYWRYHPPVHVMIAGYLGIKPPEKITDENIGQFLGVKVIEDPRPPPTSVPSGGRLTR